MPVASSCEKISVWIEARGQCSCRVQLEVGPLTYQDIDLSVQDILGLLEGVVSGTSGTCLDLVESGGEVCGAVGGIGSNGVEVGEGGILSRGEGDVLRAGALDNGERNEIGRHW